MQPDQWESPLQMLRDAQPKAGFEASGNDSYRLNVPDKGISICAELDSG